MANISHVKSYFYLKLVFFPVFFVYWLVKTLLLLIDIKQYSQGKKEYFLYEKYQKINEWLRQRAALKRIDYTFINRNSLSNTQTLYISNQEVTLDNIFVFTHLALQFNLPLVFYFSKPMKWHYMLSFFDVVYDQESIYSFLKNKCSVVAFFNQKEDLMSSTILAKNYLPINTVYVVKEKTKFTQKFLFRFGEPIKTHQFLSIDKKALVDKVFYNF